MSSPKSENDMQRPKTPDAPGEGRAGIQSATFVATGTRNLSEQDKIEIAEKVVRSLGFKKLDEFNKYDEAVQAAKRRNRDLPAEDRE
jgi:hypothetical protein